MKSTLKRKVKGFIFAAFSGYVASFVSLVQCQYITLLLCIYKTDGSCVACVYCKRVSENCK